jgi:hypothetical protein
MWEFMLKEWMDNIQFLYDVDWKSMMWYTIYVHLAGVVFHYSVKFIATVVSERRKER